MIYVELVLDFHLRCAEYVTQTLPSILSPYSCWWCLKNHSDLSAGHSLLLRPFHSSFFTLNITYPSQCLLSFCDSHMNYVLFFCCQACVIYELNEMCSWFNYSVHWLLSSSLSSIMEMTHFRVVLNIWNEAVWPYLFFFLTNKTVY